MSGALVCGALALLLWPPRRRLPGTGGPPGPRPVWPARLPVPGRYRAPASALAVALVTGALTTPLVAVLAAGGVLVAGRAAVAHRARAAEDRRARALAELLGSLAADLRAGRPPAQAAAAACAACPDRATGEAAARALRAGDAREADPGAGALAGALARLAAGVRLSERTGCSLAAVACAVEDDLRARLRLQQELRSATAAPRASALLLAGLPVVAFAMGSGIGADPWQVLTGTPVGQLLLVVGVALEAAGLAWSARLVRRAVP